MKFPFFLLLRLNVRLCGRLSLGLLLLLGLCLALAVQVRPAHAQTTLTVNDCTDDSELQADVAQANADNAGDIINFICSGGPPNRDIPLRRTLNITGSMTIDGSGQFKITLDGQKKLLPIYVGNSGSLVGNLTLNALTIANGVNGNGGGLLNTETVTISNSTFTSNSASSSGGAVLNAGTMTISNSTFTNNSTSGYGGAISDVNTMTISNSTVSGNSAVNGGGGIELTQGVNLTIAGSIVAENTSTNPSNDCANYGSITDQGYNLDSDSSCFTASTSKHGNPQLAALADNGGSTQTMALQPGSPAIDQLPLTQCPATDQRGNPRPDDASESACDIGAYESNYPPLTINGTKVSATEGAAFNGVVATGNYSGSGTLSASINWGDGTTASAGTVSLNSSTGNYSISGSHTFAEEINYSITVSVSDGQGLSASANSSATVSDAALTLTQFTASRVGHLTATATATFTDADPAGAVFDYTATITWGDGSSSSATITKGASNFTATGTHHYAKKGTYTVTLTITDQGGSQLTKTVSVTVK